MAFYPAHCDNDCNGCEKNSCGWCIWKDRSVCGTKAAAKTLNCDEHNTLEIKNEHNNQKWFYNEIW